MASMLSPKHGDDQYHGPLSPDEELEIFRARVEGWQLDLADLLLVHVKHSGYAVLTLLLSYPEMIQQFIINHTSDGDSKGYFRNGFRAVFSTSAPLLVDDDIDDFYRLARCGLFHSGGTKRGVVLDDKAATALVLAPGDSFRVNLAAFSKDIRSHFNSFCARVAVAGTDPARLKFSAFFKTFIFEVAPPAPAPASLGAPTAPAPAPLPFTAGVKPPNPTHPTSGLSGP